MIWTDDSIRFPFANGAWGVLANCLLCGAQTTFSFLAGPVCLSFSAQVCNNSVSCPLVSAAPTILSFLFCPPPCNLTLCLCQTVLSSVFPFTSNPLAHLEGTVFSLLLYYQAKMGPQTLFLPGNNTADEFTR